MAAQDLRKLKYDGKDVIAEVANRDGNGNIIASTYQPVSNFFWRTGVSYSANMVVYYNGYLFVALQTTYHGSTYETPNTSADTSYWARLFVS